MFPEQRDPRDPRYPPRQAPRPGQAGRPAQPPRPDQTGANWWDQLPPLSADDPYGPYPRYDQAGPPSQLRQNPYAPYGDAAPYGQDDADGYEGQGGYDDRRPGSRPAYGAPGQGQKPYRGPYGSPPAQRAPGQGMYPPSAPGQYGPPTQGRAGPGAYGPGQAGRMSAQARYGQDAPSSQMRQGMRQGVNRGMGQGMANPYGEFGAYGPAGAYGQPRFQSPVARPIASGGGVIARQDRIRVWSLPYLFVVIIGIGSLFTFFDIFDINVSFLQTCTQIVAGCTATNAASSLGPPVLFNLGGYVVGALVLSPLADRFGRRDMLLYTLILTGVGSLLNGFVQTYPEFIAARAITGIGVGADLVLVNTYINEVAPREGRAKYTSLILVLSAIGSVLGIWAGLLLTTPPAPFPLGIPQPFALNLPDGWRILYFIGAALMLVGVSLRAQLPESPRWLVARGKVQQADTVVRAMEDRASRRAPLASAMDEIPVETKRERTAFGVLLRTPLYRKRVALLLAVWLTGYVTVYSYIAGLASILGALHYGASESGLIVAVGVTGFIIAAVACYYLCERLERKYWLPIAAGLSVLGGILLATAGPNSHSTVTLIIAFIGSMFVYAGLIWLAPTYSWSTENFPTRARTTGFGIVDGIGHIGGGIGVLLIAPLLPQLGPWGSFFLIDAFLVVAAIIAQFGPSTRGKRLDIVSP